MSLYYSSKELRAILRDEKTTRETYTYLRKKAIQRLNRLEKGGMLFYLDNIPDLQAARGRSTEDVAKDLKELNQFLKDPFTKISYVKKFEKNMVDIMNKQGYTEINAGNVREYNKFMGEIKKRYSEDIYPVEVHDVFIQTQRLRIPIDKAIKHRDYIIKHLETIESLKPGRGEKMTMKQLYDRVRYYERKRKI